MTWTLATSSPKSRHAVCERPWLSLNCPIRLRWTLHPRRPAEPQDTAGPIHLGEALPLSRLPGITRLTLEPRLPDPGMSSSLLRLSSNCHLTPYPRILLCPGLPISLEVALRKKLRECLAGPTNLDQTSPAMVGEPRVMDLVPRIPRVLAKLQHPMPLWPSYLLLQPRP
jgi:hypothetical protein